MYGKQWRRWETPDGRVIDQIAQLVENLKRNPDSRRHVVSTWNPGDVDSMALAFGRSEAEARVELQREGRDVGEIETLLPYKVFAGNQPSTTLMLPRLDPYHLGLLIALYEHKVFVQGVVWGINSFDQWVVELGKKLAGRLLPAWKAPPTRAWMPPPGASPPIAAAMDNSEQILSLIAAVAANGAIGRDNGLLWQLPEDMAYFRQTTLGQPVIMGRKTWESLPPRFRPLPGRLNVVVSRNPAFQAPGAVLVHSLEETLTAAKCTPRAWPGPGACTCPGWRAIPPPMPFSRKFPPPPGGR